MKIKAISYKYDVPNRKRYEFYNHPWNEYFLLKWEEADAVFDMKEPGAQLDVHGVLWGD